MSQVAIREVPQEPLSPDAPGYPARKAILFVLGFALLYMVAWFTDRTFPYIRAGAALVLNAKRDDAAAGKVFPQNAKQTKIVVFGTSRILAGFVPEEFNRLARADHLQTISYNFGLPGNSEFLPELKDLVDHGNAPDVLLLTEAWNPAHNPIFTLPVSDKDLAVRFFPFRYFVRDLASFLMTSREHGGVRAFYRESHDDVTEMRDADGYYFIAEQSHYPGHRIPDSFRLPDDHPATPTLRIADPASQDIPTLNSILSRHPMLCLYVPGPYRATAYGAPPPVDESFKRVLESETPCKLVGPDYFRYPNSSFGDEIHLNPPGALVYTKDLYSLIQPYLAEKLAGRAVQ